MPGEVPEAFLLEKVKGFSAGDFLGDSSAVEYSIRESLMQFTEE